MTHDDRGGVRIPQQGERRSSSRVAVDVLAGSAAGVDDAFAAQLSSKDWRRSYRAAFAHATKLAVHGKSAVTLAEQGLASLHASVVHEGSAGPEPLDDWRRSPATAVDRLDTVTVQGQGQRLREVEVPYRGEMLRGPALVGQLDVWVARGIVEPGFAAAVTSAVENPEWLSLPGHRITMIGAAAAMGPLEQLMRWGADVVAVDVPVDRVWNRLSSIAQQGAGTLTTPSAGNLPGVHVAADLARLRPWLRAQHVATATPVLGVYAYADGAAHVEATAAADVLALDVMDDRTDSVLAFLNTPTDAFLVPGSVVDASRERWDARPLRGAPHTAARTLSAGKLFRPAYAEEMLDEADGRWGLIDTLVDVQGPNYAFAKRVHRWRATSAHHSGHRVSTTVAPASWTHSVTKNRALASVYSAAHRFGVEIFASDTAAALLAAKLVADTMGPANSADAHPESIFTDAAAHGGLWRQPFEPSSALGLAGLMGVPRTLLGRPRQR